MVSASDSSIRFSPYLLKSIGRRVAQPAVTALVSERNASMCRVCSFFEGNPVVAPALSMTTACESIANRAGSAAQNNRFDLVDECKVGTTRLKKNRSS
jgi:hypothetical protein